MIISVIFKLFSSSSVWLEVISLIFAIIAIFPLLKPIKEEWGIKSRSISEDS